MIPQFSLLYPRKAENGNEWEISRDCCTVSNYDSHGETWIEEKPEQISTTRL